MRRWVENLHWSANPKSDDHRILGPKHFRSRGLRIKFGCRHHWDGGSTSGPTRVTMLFDPLPLPLPLPHAHARGLAGIIVAAVPDLTSVVVLDFGFCFVLVPGRSLREDMNDFELRCDPAPCLTKEQLADVTCFYYTAECEQGGDRVVYVFRCRQQPPPAPLHAPGPAPASREGIHRVPARGQERMPGHLVDAWPVCRILGEHPPDKMLREGYRGQIGR